MLRPVLPIRAVPDEEWIDTGALLRLEVTGITVNYHVDVDSGCRSEWSERYRVATEVDVYRETGLAAVVLRLGTQSVRTRARVRATSAERAAINSSFEANAVCPRIH